MISTRRVATKLTSNKPIHLMRLCLPLACLILSGPFLTAAVPATKEVPPAPVPAAVGNATGNGTGSATTPSPASPATEKPAEEKAAAKEEKTSWVGELTNRGLLKYMFDGGEFMWPILVCGILAMAVILERWRSLKMLNTNNDALRQSVLDDLTHDRSEQALERCDRERGPVAAILANGLRKYIVLRRLGYDAGRIEQQVVQSMEKYGVHVVAAMERHLPILAIVSSVAPMIGFLGTVAGMIVSFDDIVRLDQSGGGTNIVTAAAAGIKIALLTTCFGLIVGIPAFSAYNYFTSVINGFVLEVEETASELMEAVTLQLTLQKAETEPTPSRDP